MKSKTWIMATAGPLVLGIISTAAQAVPITNSVADLRTAATADPPWSRPPSATAGGTMGGDTACGMAGHERMAILAGTMEHDPDQLPYGSQRWWDEMLRENRAGNPGQGGKR